MKTRLVRDGGSAVIFEADKDYLLETMAKLIACDSPVGYYKLMQPVMEELVEAMGYHGFHDRKHTFYVRVAGKDRSRTVCLGAHLDTIGMAISGIEDDGTLRVRQLGGLNYAALEGVSCRVYTRFDTMVQGVIELDHHSVHAWADAKERKRDDETIRVHLLEDVTNADEVRALDITPGAVVAFDPHLEIHDNGFILSRFIDDKACVAVLLGVLKWLAEKPVVPACDILFAFPYYEEVGFGGTYLPDDVESYISLDIALMGPDYPGTEHDVAVIADDYHGPYDWDLTNALIHAGVTALGERPEVQACLRYSTDAMGSTIASNNVAAAAMGPLTRNSHGREITHIDAMEKLQKVTEAFIMSC